MQEILRMTGKEKAELYWAYAISVESTAKRLVEKGIASQGDANDIIQRLYDNIHEVDIDRFKASPGCAMIMQTYLKKTSLHQYLSLTDIAREKDKNSPSYVIQGWLRSRNTLEFLKIWETKCNPEFGEAECNQLLEAMKTPSFTVTPKRWIETTKAIGLQSKQGKNGGTFAHPDIAGDFYMWLYPEFRLTLMNWFRENKGDK
jgi:hypothetical protein